MASIQLKTEVPPKSKAVTGPRRRRCRTGSARRRRWSWSGEGARARRGRQHLPRLRRGIGALRRRHLPPPVVQAVQQQAASLIHMGSLVAPTSRSAALRAAERADAGSSPRRRCWPTGAERSRTRQAARATPNGRRESASRRLPRAQLLTLTLTSKYSLFRRAWARSRRRLRCRCERLPPARSLSAEQATMGPAARAGVHRQVDPPRWPHHHRTGAARAASSRFAAVPAGIRELCTQHGIVMSADESVPLRPHRQALRARASRGHVLTPSRRRGMP